MAVVTYTRYPNHAKKKPFFDNTMLNERTGCVEWIGDRNPQGYGVALKIVGEPHEAAAHRRAWEIRNGEIPAGLRVLHRCDNPSCVNADHLFLGTDADNTADKYRKKRNINLAGAEHGMAKLSPEDVLRIREAALFGARFATLGRMWGINESTAADIVKRRSWKHL